MSRPSSPAEPSPREVSKIGHASIGDYRVEQDAAHRLGVEVAGGWVRSASPEQRKALNWYRDGGFRKVNEELRTGVPVDPDLAEQRRSWGAAFTNDQLRGHMDRVLASSAPPTPVTTFRGVGPREAGRLLAMAPGESFSDPGYTSTTLSPSYAYTGFGTGGGAVLRIHVPAGTPAAYLSAEDKTEQELLLGRGMRYTVTGRGEESGPDGTKYPVVHVTATPAPAPPAVVFTRDHAGGTGADGKTYGPGERMPVAVPPTR